MISSDCEQRHVKEQSIKWRQANACWQVIACKHRTDASKKVQANKRASKQKTPASKQTVASECKEVNARKRMQTNQC